MSGFENHELEPTGVAACAELSASVRKLHCMDIMLGLQPDENPEPGTYYDITCTISKCDVTTRVLTDGPASYAFYKPENDSGDAYEIEVPVCIAASNPDHAKELERISAATEDRMIKLDAQARNLRHKS